MSTGNALGKDGAFLITQTLSKPMFGFDPSLPRPLCWTVPNGNKHGGLLPEVEIRSYAMSESGYPVARGGKYVTVPALPPTGVNGGAVVPRAPKLMMDPSDPSTWQRDYVLDSGGNRSGQLHNKVAG